jgi:hypothetical protein
MMRADGEPDADIIMFQLTADKAVVLDSLVSPLVPVKRHLWSCASSIRQSGLHYGHLQGAL